jgi:hypothetical protein
MCHPAQRYKKNWHRYQRKHANGGLLKSHLYSDAILATFERLTSGSKLRSWATDPVETLGVADLVADLDGKFCAYGHECSCQTVVAKTAPKCSKIILPTLV